MLVSLVYFVFEIVSPSRTGKHLIYFIIQTLNELFSLKIVVIDKYCSAGSQAIVDMRHNTELNKTEQGHRRTRKVLNSVQNKS